MSTRSSFRDPLVVKDNRGDLRIFCRTGYCSMADNKRKVVHAGSPLAVQVEICDGPHRTPIGDDVKPLDRKRQAVWRFGARNDQLADIADACVERDVQRLWKLGLFVDREAFPYPAPGPNWVAVLVESPEHARELARRLPQPQGKELAMDEMAQNGWRRGREYDARPAARHDLPVDAHVGTAADYVSRLQAVAQRAGQPNSETKKEFFVNLFDWLTDERNLMIALQQQQERRGGPGIDGLRFSDLPPRKQRGPVLRDLRDQLRSGEYEPLPLLRQPIPKGEGDDKRPLDIPAIFDRVVGRAIVQALEPYLDGLFLPFSFGYRRNRDRRHAIAYAGATAFHCGSSAPLPAKRPSWLPKCRGSESKQCDLLRAETDDGCTSEQE